MSILIRGLKMPTSCEECAFRIDESETNVHEWICLINQYPTFYCKKSKSHAEGEEYLQYCPLVPVPPHGRLIDADAMIEANAELADCDFIHPRIGATLRDVVEDAPTIVEAEGED